MGLDISFYKLKNNKNVPSNVNSRDDWSIVTDEAGNQAKKTLKRVYDDCIKKLKNASREGYDYVYYLAIKRLCKYDNYPQFTFKDLGVEFNYQTNKYQYHVVPLNVFEENEEKILEEYYMPSIAYFRKVNFIYRFFQHKLIDEVAWVTRGDIEELIRRCDAVLNDNNLAEELLPTQNGFFFGSTEYDHWYFDDVKYCKKQMKKVLRGFKDNELMYVYMSW